MAVYDLTEKVWNFRFGTWRGRENNIVSLLTYLLSVLSLSLGFFECFVLLFSMATCYLALVCVLYVFCLLVGVVWFSVPVRLTAKTRLRNDL